MGIELINYGWLMIGVGDYTQQYLLGTIIQWIGFVGKILTGNHRYHRFSH